MTAATGATAAAAFNNGGGGALAKQRPRPPTLPAGMRVCLAVIHSLIRSFIHSCAPLMQAHWTWPAARQKGRA